MKIVFVAGGTGGHVYPAISLANFLKRNYTDIDIMFIGHPEKLEAKEVVKNGFEFKGIYTKGFVGSVKDKLLALRLFLAGINEAKGYLKEYNPDIVIGFGGYISAPVVFAASLLKIKTIIHEQNSDVGLANKFLARFVDKIVVCFPSALEQLPKKKTYLFGNPRATDMLDLTKNSSVESRYSLEKDKKLILITMGSLGSKTVNDKMISMLDDLEKRNYQTIFVTGKKNYQDVIEKVNKKYHNIQIVDYVNTLELYPYVDLLICRSGASTISEISALGLCSIMIPSPYVTNNHQVYNANTLVLKNGALMIEEKNLEKDLLLSYIDRVLNDSCEYEQICENAKKAGFPRASYDIAQLMFDLLKEK